MGLKQHKGQWCQNVNFGPNSSNAIHAARPDFAKLDAFLGQHILLQIQYVKFSPKLSLKSEGNESE